MKIGIIGAGKIVPTFLRAAQLVEQIQIEAICGRESSESSVRRLSTQYGIPHAYLDYGEMLANADIDAVYIAVPNHLHHAFAHQALLSGKNAIVEKPFTANFTQADELARLAQSKRLFLFEAITNQYCPNYRRTKELIGQLGAIKMVEINYSQYSSRYDAFQKGEIHPVFDPRQAGGALMDLNVYGIHFVVGLFKKPQSHRYYANVEKGIDTSGVLIMEYPAFKCVLIAAKDSWAKNRISIQGTQGYIHSSSKANAFTSFIYKRNDADPVEVALNTVPERLFYELEAFCSMVADGDYAMMRNRLAHSLQVMKILDESRAQVNMQIEA